MSWLFLLTALIFVLIGIGCLVLVVFGLPGIWIMIGVAIIIELADGLYLEPDESQTFSWWVIGVAIGLALLGELMEFGASVIGTKAGGGTKRGMIGAVIGGIGGALLLTPFIPVPVVGSLIGALVGTFAGASIGELTARDSTVRGTLKPATGATIARILATVAKMGVAVVIWVSLSISAFWP